MERLAGQERSELDCGSAALSTYLGRQAGPEQRRRLAACFVAMEQASSAVVGIYTLSACQFWLDGLGIEQQHRLPRYPTVPSVIFGRLAIDRRFQRRGLGASMLANAVERAVRAEVTTAIMVGKATSDRPAKLLPASRPTSRPEATALAACGPHPTLRHARHLLGRCTNPERIALIQLENASRCFMPDTL